MTTLAKNLGQDKLNSTKQECGHFSSSIQKEKNKHFKPLHDFKVSAVYFSLEVFSGKTKTETLGD